MEATVFAVMKVILEIPVRPSHPSETLAEMHTAAKREAAAILNHALGDKAKVVGEIEFSHAIVKGGA
jgi:hypothetical protein